jgi:hypothetical protein
VTAGGGVDHPQHVDAHLVRRLLDPLALFGSEALARTFLFISDSARAAMPAASTP